MIARGARHRIRVLDHALFVRLAHAHSPVLDTLMPRLTRAADHSALWIGTAGVITVLGDRRAVRGAWRGLASIAVASLLANQVGKRLARRARPDIGLVPDVRRSPRIPLSTSFPSGHAASAAAFATAVTLERPGLGWPLLPLAGAVAFSRVYTGVHHPSDVLAGAALGGAVAAFGSRVRPMSTRRARRTISGDRVALRPRPRGEGVLVVVNPSAGRGTAVRAARVLAAELPAARTVIVDPAGDVVSAIRAAAAGVEVIAVCGGDGTANAAARVALELGLPFCALPGGTFNHFATDLGLTSVSRAVGALRRGTAARIDVGTVETDAGGATPFLNTASIGAYPEFASARAALMDRVGGPVATAWAIVRVWADTTPVEATVDGVPVRLAAVFVGNGVYSPSRDAPQWRERLDRGELDLRYVDARTWPELLGLVARILSGRLGPSDRYAERTTRGFRVEVAAPTRITCDGEVCGTATTIEFGVRPRALTVYVAAGV